jgi:hypothetical protein
MKNSLIIFVLCLIFTCWLTDSGGPPKPVPVAINGMTEGTLGSEHKDSSYSDFTYADKVAPKSLLTTIGEKDSTPRPDYPFFAIK